MTQAEFGTALGSSHRTATRWDAGEARPYASELAKLAALLVPLDLELAGDAAAYAGETLEGLALVRPPPSSPASAAPASVDLVDIVVCAVADLADSPPRTVRPLLHAAFKRAREVGLSVEAAERALAPPPAPESASAGKAGSTKKASRSR